MRVLLQFHHPVLGIIKHLYSHLSVAIIQYFLHQSPILRLSLLWRAAKSLADIANNALIGLRPPVYRLPAIGRQPIAKKMVSEGL